MTENEALELLRDYYESAGYVYVTKVKDGPTWFRNEYPVMDAIAIKKTWVKPCVTGIEVKVNRADFMGDKKWPKYLDVVNCFYFAAPPGVIKKEELPPGIGLFTLGKSAHVVKSASVKNLKTPDELFRFLVFSRLSSSECPFHARSAKAEHYRAWAEAKKEGKEASGHFRFEMHKMIYEAEKVLKENKELKERNSELRREIKKIQALAGADWRHNDEKALELIKDQISAGVLINKLPTIKRNAVQCLQEALNNVQNIEIPV